MKLFFAICLIYSIFILGKCNLLANVSSPVEFFEININREHPEELYKAFEDFIVKYKRDYKTVEEKKYRFNNFVRSYNKVSQLKKKSEESGMNTHFDVNKFADWSDAEFKGTLLRSSPANSSNIPSFDSFREENTHPTRHKRDNSKYPKSFSLTTFKKNGRYVVGPIKNQGSCACCWGFAITALSETANAIITGKYTALSDQELCDCGTTGSPGCKGGTLENGLQYINRYGQSTEKDYPYDSKRATKGGQCKLRKTSRLVNPGRLRYFSINRRKAEEQIIEVLHDYNVPVTSGFKVGDAFKHYSGGILAEEDCDKSSEWHAGAIVGYDSLEYKGRKYDYWIVRNSWDSDWGENGYYRVLRGINWCGLEDSPISGDLKNTPSKRRS